MSKEQCKATVYWGRGNHSKCSNNAGYGPGKAYCKIHAREQGEIFGKVVTLYIVLPKNSRSPIHLVEYQVEDTGKTYRCSGKDSGLGYAVKLPKDKCPRKGIFTTKEEAITFFVEKAHQAVISAKTLLERMEQEEKDAILFERSQP